MASCCVIFFTTVVIIASLSTSIIFKNEKSPGNDAYNSSNSLRNNDGRPVEMPHAHLLRAFNLDRLRMHSLMNFRNRRAPFEIRDRENINFDTLEKELTASAILVDPSFINKYCLQKANIWGKTSQAIFQSCSHRCKNASLWGCFYFNSSSASGDLIMSSFLEKYRRYCSEKWNRLMLFEENKYINVKLKQKSLEILANHHYFTDKDTRSAHRKKCTGSELRSQCLLKDSNLINTTSAEILSSDLKLKRGSIINKKMPLPAQCNVPDIFLGECMADSITKECEFLFLFGLRNCLI